MRRHAYALAGVSAVVVTATLISPGHALLLAVGLATGPLLSRWLQAGASVVLPARNDSDVEGPGGPKPDVIEALALPVVVLDRRSNVVDANGAASQALPALKRGSPLSFALRDPSVLEAVNTTIRENVSQTVELIERAPVERAFVCHVAPFASGAAKPGSAVAVMLLRDISRERAVETMRVDFVANASHELRTPLASVIGFIETLQGPARNDTVAREKFLGIMLAQAQRMARLVDDLLSLSRIELKEHIAPTSVVDIGEIVDGGVLALSELARERGVAISIDRQTTDTRIVGDRDELASVVDNLVENAIKYGKSGGKVDLTIADTPSRQEISVSVRDYGPGISPVYLPRLTERFYRVDSNVSRSEGGTGLGLALVKHTINRHRGRLTIVSVEGEGATFCITLPRPTPIQ